MPRGPRQAGQKLKEPSAKEALVCEVKKAVNPLAFESEKLQYTFFAVFSGSVRLVAVCG